MGERTDILPHESAPPAAWRASAWLVVAAVAMVVLANFAVAAILNVIPVNGGYALARGKWLLMDRAIDRGEKLDCVIVGDSSSNQGLDPRVIASVAGKSAMNFGIVADGSTIEPLWALRRYLENTPADRRPKTVLWMHVYDIWNRSDPRNNRVKGIATALPPTAWPQIEAGPRVAFTIDDLKWRRLVPIWSQNTSTQLLVRRPIDSYHVSRRFQFDDRGFTAETTPDPALVAKDTRQHIQAARGNDDVRPNKFTRETLKAMADLAEKYDFDLWLVEAPLNQTLWADAAFRRKWFEVHAALVEFARGHRRVHVVFDEPMTFADERMQNCDHVLADAAAEFTRGVVERVWPAR